MDGVILFVDDKVNDYSLIGNEIKRSLENELFETLKKDYPVLGIKNLEMANDVVKSIGSFSAIILDWIFDDKQLLLNDGENENDLVGLKLPKKGEDTLEFLRKNDFYSPVYIFSNEDVRKLCGKELKKKFSKRIKFRKKGELKGQANRIANDIKLWKSKHQSLEIPSLWTKTINQSIQKIFVELANADENWLRELGTSAKDDGVNGEVFIIEILQYLLSESLVQNQNLVNAINSHLNNVPDDLLNSDEKSVSKLFRRLFYTKLNHSDPIMTGDICRLKIDKFGIIITPECDIKDVVNDGNRTFELLTFTKDSFYNFVASKGYELNGLTDKQRKNLRQSFNNGEAKYHILPSFPFTNAIINQSVVIDFSLGCERFSAEKIKNKRTYKLNSPFIQQLRQRYISHLGRVGVPSLPKSVRNFNLI